jgi:hypothetical protein
MLWRAPQTKFWRGSEAGKSKAIVSARQHRRMAKTRFASQASRKNTAQAWLLRIVSARANGDARNVTIACNAMRKFARFAG